MNSHYQSPQQGFTAKRSSKNPDYTTSAPDSSRSPSRSSPLNDSSHSFLGSEDERLARLFNTALISTHAKATENLSQELHTLMVSPSFQVILSATRQLAQQQGISEREAAESIIQTFRKMDRI